MADRILLLVAGVALVVQGSVPLVVGILVLAREVVVSVAVLVLAAAGARRIDVQWAGKAGTLALMCRVPAVPLGRRHPRHRPRRRARGRVVHGRVRPLFSYYAAFMYVPLARAALREGRSTQTAGSIS